MEVARASIRFKRLFRPLRIVQDDLSGSGKHLGVEARVIRWRDVIAARCGLAEAADAEQARAAVAALEQRLALLAVLDAAHAGRTAAARRHALPAIVGARAAAAPAAVIAAGELADAVRGARHALPAIALLAERAVAAVTRIAAGVRRRTARAGLAREWLALAGIAALIRNAGATALVGRGASSALHGAAAGIGHRAARTGDVVAGQWLARARGFARAGMTELVVGAAHPGGAIERQPAAHGARRELGLVTPDEEHEHHRDAHARILREAGVTHNPIR